MALIFNSITYDESAFIVRVDPKYYQLQEELKSFKSNSDVDMCNFGALILNITDGEHAGQTFVKNGILFLKNSSIKDFDISVNDGFYITKRNHNRLARSAIKSGDILFTTIGHLGSAAIVPEEFCEANMNQNFVKIQVDAKKINPYYVACFLNSKFARKQIKALLTGNIQSILTYPKIRNIKIVFPTDNKRQVAIANKYKEATKLSQDAENKIKKALSIFESHLKIDKEAYPKMFNVSCDDFCNVPMWTVKAHLPEYVQTEQKIIDNHRYVNLGKITTMRKGDEPGSDSYSDYLDKTVSDVPFIRTSDIYNYQIDLSPDNFVDNATYKDLSQDVEVGDVIFTKDGKIAECAMVTESDRAVYQSGIAIIRINDYGKSIGLTQEYIFTAMICNKIGKYTADRYTVTASTIPHLKEHYIKEMKIPLLDESVILEITHLIKQAFTCIEEKKKLIQECKDMVDDITGKYFK